MKKSFFILVLAIFATGLLFAQDAGTAVSPEENTIALEYANYLFEDGFVKKNNAEKIAELSPFLTASQRESLYAENEQLGVGPFLLNLLVGFGSGSFWQGDTTMGCIQLFGDIVGYGLLIPGIAISMSAAKDGKSSGAGTALTIVGSLVTIGVAIPACIRPWTFASARNARLRRALRVDENGKAVALFDEAKDSVSVSFAPVISPVTHEYGLMARIAF